MDYDNIDMANLESQVNLATHSTHTGLHKSSVV